MTKKERWTNFMWIFGCLLSWCFGYFVGASDCKKHGETNIIKHHTKTQISDKDLFYAIAQVESNHDDNAVGDNGKSKGRYQIGRMYWKDSCGYLNADIDYESNVEKHNVCEVIMKAYWKRYDANTLEEKCRVHNGGPKGMEKDATKQYWNKVKKVLKGIS